MKIVCFAHAGAPGLLTDGSTAPQNAAAMIWGMSLMKVKDEWGAIPTAIDLITKQHQKLRLDEVSRVVKALGDMEVQDYGTFMEEVVNRIQVRLGVLGTSTEFLYFSKVACCAFEDLLLPAGIVFKDVVQLTENISSKIWLLLTHCFEISLRNEICFEQVAVTYTEHQMAANHVVDFAEGLAALKFEDHKPIMDYLANDIKRRSIPLSDEQMQAFRTAANQLGYELGSLEHDVAEAA